MVCALFEAGRTGKGQVVDAAMLDGVMSLYSVFYGMSQSGMHTEQIGSNLFDGGAPFYNVYETSDGKYVTVAPIEPHFYRQLLDAIGVAADDLPQQWDQSRWPAVRDRLAEVFRTKTRDEWTALLEGTDVCYAPVMRLAEAHEHPHNVARGAFVMTLGRAPAAPVAAAVGDGGERRGGQPFVRVCGLRHRRGAGRIRVRRRRDCRAAGGWRRRLKRRYAPRRNVGQAASNGSESSRGLRAATTSRRIAVRSGPAT